MQQRQTSIARWCERIIEGGWLLALVFIPSYFNMLSSRHFEPDKATSLRAIVLVMVAAAVVRWLDSLGANRRATSDTSGGPKPSFWKRILAFPMALAVLLYVVVFIFATIVSVAPTTSLWGSYQRLQGTYTNLSYVGLATLIVLHLRRREQLDRFIVVAVLGSLIAIGYGLVQHFQVDPLPWRGDVVSRVASTMGNSIFVAAYLILVLPFALYQAISGFYTAARAERSGDNADWGWALGYLLLAVGALAMAFAAIQFSAVVRTIELRYWWVYPGAVVVALGLFLVPTLRPHSAERINPAMLVPGIGALLYVVMIGFAFWIGQASGTQNVQAQPGRGGLEWWIWLLGGGLAVIAAYVLFFNLPRSAGASRRLLRLQGVAMLAIALLITITIVFTQSRGPWFGGLVGMFVFFTLTLILALRRARASGSPRTSLWRNLLAAEFIGAVLLGVFIVVFNFVDAPVFDQLRTVPYIGRMGRLLDVSPGTTGDVRMKIWFGDEKAGGAAGLITSDPLRMLVGWGPESMFVAYNKFYPPSLANVESRGASPDRSHQAYLDELVTKGLLGLISYLFVIISALVLAWKLIRRTDEWPIQVLLVACISVIVSHSVEGLTGIPIVASLMMLWVTLSVVVVVGVLMGEYGFAPAPQPAAEPIEVAPVPAKGTPQPAKGTRGAGRRGQGAAARGAAQARATTARKGQSVGPLGMLVYGLIMAIGLAGAWFLNVDNVYADMRFQQGQIYAEGSNATLQQQFAGMQYYLDAVRMEPDQDFYYLSLGRNLMSITDIRRQTGAELGEPKPNANLNDLLRAPDTVSFVNGLSLQESMSYAESVLTRAYQINPMNKDHSANLARLHTFWYSRLTQDPAQLQQAIEWYANGSAAAPQDVVVMNEYAGAVALLGNYSQSKGDTSAAQSYYDQASQLLSSSKQLDARYPDTDVRIADLQRIQGKTAEAVGSYIALIDANPHALDAQFTLILNSVAGNTELQTQMRDAYERALVKSPDDPVLNAFVGQLSVDLNDYERASTAFGRQVELQPTNFEARRNYTLVLSDTRAYTEAVAQAEQMLSLSQQNQDTQQAAQVQALIDFLRGLQAGG